MDLKYVHLDYEHKFWNNEYDYVIGFDEVGKGSLAGPVVVAAVIFSPYFYEGNNTDELSTVRDSKKITRLKREKLFRHIYNHSTSCSIGYSHPSVIDEHGIVHATHRAALQALNNLDVDLDKSYALTDNRLLSKKLDFPIKYAEIEKGDEQCFSIAAASIIAKVWRDVEMRTIAYTPDLNNYGWETNVGYGTKKHVDAIKKHGVTPLHRRSFLGNII